MDAVAMRWVSDWGAACVGKMLEDRCSVSALLLPFVKLVCSI